MNVNDFYFVSLEVGRILIRFLINNYRLNYRLVVNEKTNSIEIHFMITPPYKPYLTMTIDYIQKPVKGKF